MWGQTLNLLNVGLSFLRVGLHPQRCWVGGLGTGRML